MPALAPIDSACRRGSPRSRHRERPHDGRRRHRRRSRDDDDPRAAPLDHRQREGAGVERTKPSCITGGAGRQARRAGPGRRRRSAHRSAARSRPSAGTCRRRAPAPGRACQPSRVRLESRRPRTDRRCVQTTLVRRPEEPREVADRAARPSRCESRCSRSHMSGVSCGASSRSMATWTTWRVVSRSASSPRKSSMPSRPLVVGR